MFVFFRDFSVNKHRPELMHLSFWVIVAKYSCFHWKTEMHKLSGELVSNTNTKHVLTEWKQADKKIEIKIW